MALRLVMIRPRVVLSSYDRRPPDDDAIAVRRPDELDTVEAAQLVAAAGRGSELAFTVADLFAPDFAARGGDAEWIAIALETPFEWWDVVDEASGAVRFQLWLYSADCGLVFDAGSTRAVAQAIQFGSAWDLHERPFSDDASLREAFAAAHRAAVVAHPNSNLSAFYALERGRA